jgi:isoleucyl-tRNA synthetase
LNTTRFFELYSDPKEASVSVEPKTILDKWLTEKFGSLVAQVTENLDKYNPSGAAKIIEDFVLNDLSNWWIRRSRKRFQKPENEIEKVYVASFLRKILLELSKLIAPFAPFIAEEIHLTLHNGIKMGTQSIHLHDWPEINVKLKNQNEKLIKDMAELRNFVALGLGARKAKQLKVRQPLASITFKRTEKFDPKMEELAKDELNIKEIKYDASQEGEVVLDENLTEELKSEGYAREIMRQIQDMRKEAKYKLDEKVIAAWESDVQEMKFVMEKFGKDIADDTLLSELLKGHSESTKFDIEKEFEIVSGVKIWLGVRK